MTDQAEKNLPVLDVGGEEKTTVGNYFVSNYPPYSFWTPQQVQLVLDRLATPAEGAAPPLGLYIHIPFCRKRCDFCYFKVYTDKNAKQIQQYMDAVIEEMRMISANAYLKDRPLDFVYFGGGTPSYLSVKQLQYLFDGIQQYMPWDDASEIAFECEPGTLQEKKIHALRDMGITRLSIGVENFDPEILELNNRAHRAKEIHRAYGFARDAGFPQVNIDLIAGMVGETDENWLNCIEETIKLAPESVTIYQMEIPYNTTIFRRMQDGNTRIAPVADWDTKRRWVSEAFDTLMKHGYLISSAYTAVRDDTVDFRYRDALWRGADMLGLGVSSIAHMGGIHYQNEHKFDPYIERVERGELPIARAMPVSDRELFIREFVLQLKLGHSDFAYFRDKFGIDVAAEYAEQLQQHESNGMLALENGGARLTRDGLLQVDRLLPSFFLEEHREARYA